jgi:protein gp37
MSKTKIQWTDETLNCVTGCTQLSAGCANCYAKRNAMRLQKNPNPKVAHKYQNAFDVTVHPECLELPLKWKKPRKVFVNSMSDTFHPDVPEDFIRKLFERIAECPQHIFQVLTKRADRLAELSDRLPWPTNLWMGVTVERADYISRLEHLRKVPAYLRFISFEPLLGAIPDLDLTGIDWVIVGGESGPNARPLDLQWARAIRNRCVENGVPFFFKQIGGTGRAKGGRLLDGYVWNEFPVDF